MSRLSIVPAQAVCDKRLSPRDITVLAAICIHTDRAGWCYPSQTTLGKILGVSRQAVQKSIKHLQECGYVQTIIRYDTVKNAQITNLTRVLLDAIIDAQFLRVDKDPATSEVAPPATPEVAPPATSEVAQTSHLTTQLTIKTIGQQADRFPEFWQAYPKKVKKKEAHKVWKSKRLDAHADRLIEDVGDRLNEDGRWIGGFVPDPPTYLRGERWNDEFTEVKR